MSFDIAVVGKAALAKKQDQVASMLSDNLKFLQTIKLVSDGGKETKEKHQSEFFAPKAGDFIIEKKVLGRKFKAIPVDMRTKAMNFLKGGVEKCFDMEDPEFDRIASEEDGSHGPEFLCWLPEVEGFGLLFFKGTARDNASGMTTRMGECVYVYTDSMSSSKHEWYVPGVVAGDYQLEDDKQPDKKLFEKASDMFNFPEKYEKKDKEEPAEKAAVTKKKRAR